MRIWATRTASFLHLSATTSNTAKKRASSVAGKIVFLKIHQSTSNALRGQQTGNLFLGRRDRRAIVRCSILASQVGRRRGRRQAHGVGDDARLPCYMSPRAGAVLEERRRAPDIWSLGVILYQLLTAPGFLRGVRDLGALRRHRRAGAHAAAGAPDGLPGLARGHHPALRSKSRSCASRPWRIWRERSRRSARALRPRPVSADRGDRPGQGLSVVSASSGPRATASRARSPPRPTTAQARRRPCRTPTSEREPGQVPARRRSLPAATT